VRTVTAFGVLGGFSPMRGWVRWPITVPHPSAGDAEATDPGAREAIAASYDVLDRYAGGALGAPTGGNISVVRFLWLLVLSAMLIGRARRARA
jgi:hypothetical protein